MASLLSLGLQGRAGADLGQWYFVLDLLSGAPGHCTHMLAASQNCPNLARVRLHNDRFRIRLLHYITLSAHLFVGGTL